MRLPSTVIAYLLGAALCSTAGAAGLDVFYSYGNGFNAGHQFSSTDLSQPFTVNLPGLALSAVGYDSPRIDMSLSVTGSLLDAPTSVNVRLSYDWSIVGPADNAITLIPVGYYGFYASSVVSGTSGINYVSSYVGGVGGVTPPSYNCSATNGTSGCGAFEYAGTLQTSRSASNSITLSVTASASAPFDGSFGTGSVNASVTGPMLFIDPVWSAAHPGYSILTTGAGNAAPVPEPGSTALMLAGMLGLAGWTGRGRRSGSRAA